MSIAFAEFSYRLVPELRAFQGPQRRLRKEYTVVVPDAA